jgi:DNA-binding response OmpR family regulator
MPKKQQTPPEQDLKPTAVKEPSGKGKKRILIVEDERPLAHALELKMTHEGYDVCVKLTGAEGLQEALAGKYHLMLLDLIMPEMDGFAVLEALRQKGNKMPVIVLSNLGQDEDKQKALALGATDYFVKANTPILEIVTKVKSIH